MYPASLALHPRSCLPQSHLQTLPPINPSWPNHRGMNIASTPLYQSLRLVPCSPHPRYGKNYLPWYLSPDKNHLTNQDKMFILQKNPSHPEFISPMELQISGFPPPVTWLKNNPLLFYIADKQALLSRTKQHPDKPSHELSCPNLAHNKKTLGPIGFSGHINDC